MQQKHQLPLFTAVICLLHGALALPNSESRSEDNSCSSGATVGAPVDTSSGTIIGHAAVGYPEVSEYLGIPFAQPPLGGLRFAAPQPFQGNASLVADREPLSCIQAPSTVNYSQPQNWQNIAATKAAFANHTSEDCLYLNVWSSVPKQGHSLKPVMVWFYGGGFHSGGAADTSEQGALFAAEQDVVIVNFNYRLSIFGFSGAPGQTQNIGLLDQRMVLEWIRDNIRGFGGDPCRITIFGHSAGSVSVDLYNFAWLSDPIIAGSIIMSGTASSFGIRYPNTTAAAWYETAALAECGNHTSTSDTDILSCMRSKDALTLLTASQNASKIIGGSLSSLAQIYAGITGVFGPTIDNRTVFTNYSIRGEEGKFIPKPVIIGNNIDEACFFSEGGLIPVSDDAVLTESVFTCPTNWGAIWRASKGLNVWKYSYKGAWPNLYAPDCPGKPWHGQEVYVLFGSTVTASQQPATHQELQVGAYLRDAWSAFAHDPKAGLNSLGWPTFGHNESNVIELGLNGTILEKVGSATVVDAQCFTVYRNGAPNF